MGQVFHAKELGFYIVLHILLLRSYLFMRKYVWGKGMGYGMIKEKSRKPKEVQHNNMNLNFLGIVLILH